MSEHIFTRPGWDTTAHLYTTDGPEDEALGIVPAALAAVGFVPEDDDSPLPAPVPTSVSVSTDIGDRVDHSVKAMVDRLLPALYVATTRGGDVSATIRISAIRRGNDHEVAIWAEPADFSATQEEEQSPGPPTEAPSAPATPPEAEAE